VSDRNDFNQNIIAEFRANDAARRARHRSSTRATATGSS
jgi:hypothetical protein